MSAFNTSQQAVTVEHLAMLLKEGEMRAARV